MGARSCAPWRRSGSRRRCNGSAAAAPALRLHRLGVEQGLPQSTVMAMAQDAQGFVWLGTQSGLARFDGYRAVVYKHAAAEDRGLQDDAINALHLDAEGTLWVGHGKGLQRYDPASDRFVTCEPPWPAQRDGMDRYVRAIVDDRHGGLWIGTFSGLLHYDPRRRVFRRWLHDDADAGSLVHNVVRSLAMEADGGLWIGTRAGLDHLANGASRFEHHHLRGAASRDPLADDVESLMLDAAQRLWIGTAAGLQRRDVARAVMQPFNLDGVPQLARASVHSLQAGPDGAVWAGTTTQGVFRWDPERLAFDAYPHDAEDAHSVPENHVESLLLDRSGALWLGTWAAGAGWMDVIGGGFHRLPLRRADPSALSNGRVFQITGADDGTMWIATLEGVSRFDPRSGRVSAVTSPGVDPVLSGALDDRGTLWVGTRRGVHWFDARAGRFHRLAVKADNPDAQAIRGIWRDRRGALWLSTYAGLHRLDPVHRQMRSYYADMKDDATLGNDTVFKVIEDRRGALWMPTLAGLERLDRDSGRFTHFRHRPNDPHSLAADVLFEVFEDSGGGLWVGGMGLLARAQAQPDGSMHFTNYRTEAQVLAIEEGPDGQLWVARDDGLATFDPRSGRWRRFLPADGLPEGDFNNDASSHDAEGRLYFGHTSAGMVYFDPRALRANAVAPQVAITELRVHNQPLHHDALPEGVQLAAPIERARSLVLSSAQATFSLEFAALHFADPQRNRYAYRLRGLDRDWIETDAGHRSASYTRLPAGDYVFEVKAQSKDGVWSAQPASLAITVTPPYWQTWWFRLPLTLAALLVVWGLHRWRLRRLVHQKRRLQEQVAARTAEVTQAMAELKSAQEQLVLHEKMASVGTLTAGISHEINNPANFAHAGAQALAEELQRFGHYLVALADDAEIGQSLQRRVDALSVQAATIVEGTTRIRALVRDMRSFSRVEDGERQLARVGEPLRTTAHLVRTQHGRQVDIRLDLEADPEIPCWPTQLAQVFMNLTVNACQAIEQRQRDSGDATPGRLDIGTRLEPPWLTIEFRDTGCGMSPEVAARAFEPFFTTKPVGEGNGLGLAISFGIVQRHGGRIELQSTPGTGTCVTVRLPLSLDPPER